MEPEHQLRIISKAWGRQSGYCFFPVIRGDAKDKTERIQSYREGQAYLWPQDRDKILNHLREHQADDVYWCPSLFEQKRRLLEVAMDEHCLWADLDEVNPSELAEYPPTIAWETSPGRYQALWLTQGDIQGASWPGRENQCLTYHIGADPSGWDTTQLLRIPGWGNHKPEYRGSDGEVPQGKLLWDKGRTYLPDEFNDLPDVPAISVVNEVLEEEVERIDRHEVWGRVRLQVSSRVRELVGAREASGDRSDALWEMERELADAGCTIAEIVAVVRATVWNKFAGRSDELRRLSTEATKAVALRSDEGRAELEVAHTERPKPQRLFDLIRNIPVPRWLVKDVLTEGGCGFIAGQPKSFKSWCALDLALSVSTGAPFLGYFDILNPGPVLYIQEEDSAAMVKQRVDKIWPGKMIDKMMVGKSGIEWVPSRDMPKDPPVDGYVGEGFVVSDPSWQAWLDETMGRGEYSLVIMDPLMMIAGEVEETKSQAMTEKVFKPLKQLARKHHSAMVVVHHMKKGDPRGGPQRGGQLMLGSVANHAWAEDSLYLRLGRGGDIVVEQESKSATGSNFRISHVRNQKWEPTIIKSDEGDPEPEGAEGRVRKNPKVGKEKPKILQALNELGPGLHTTKTIAEAAGVTTNTAYKQLTRQASNNKVTKQGSQWMLRSN